MSENSDPIVVRAAEDRDLLAVAVLWSEMRLEETRHRDPETSPSDVDSFYRLVARRFRDPARILLVAYRDGRAVGFYSGRMRGCVGGGLDVFVTAKSRRRGVGRSLVEAALASYRERGAERIVGALRGDAASLAFWASIWREHPSSLLSARWAAGVEWRTRSLVAPSDPSRPGRAQGDCSRTLPPPSHVGEIRGPRGSRPASRTRSSRPPSTP
ncbi:MAG TPA: GNAT family N-acetyltransferase [Actinomycetota bacterium]|nr:GNAT family N-acetyltransferase [Actinomycetota bacterium]